MLQIGRRGVSYASRQFLVVCSSARPLAWRNAPAAVLFELRRRGDFRRAFSTTPLAYRDASPDKEPSSIPRNPNQNSELIERKAYTLSSFSSSWLKAIVAIISAFASVAAIHFSLKEDDLPQLEPYEKRFVAAIQGPTYENEILDIFATFVNKESGKMTKEGWKKFGELYWRAVVLEPGRQVQHEVRQLYEEKAGWPFFDAIVGSLAFQATGFIALEVEPLDKAAFLENSFKLADANGDGVISFDEFVAFLPKYGPIFSERRRIAVREAVVENMKKNNGGLKGVRTRPDGFQSRVSVTLPGINPDDVLHPRQS